VCASSVFCDRRVHNSKVDPVGTRHYDTLFICHSSAESLSHDFNLLSGAELLDMAGNERMPLPLIRLYKNAADLAFLVTGYDRGDLERDIGPEALALCGTAVTLPFDVR
jgi:hypothetical protein